MWNLQSRVHLLNGFPKDGVCCYVKREDELSGGISGSKIRKYHALIPYFKTKNIGHIIIIAGTQSNNLLAALQVARELNIQVSAFLLKPTYLANQGNFKLSQLFLAAEEIVWIAREHWLQVEKLAYVFLQKVPVPGFILTEGASVPQALSGCVSLAHDIINNEKNINGIFHHIFVDAGTGFTAAGLIKGMMQAQHQALIHVLLLAENKEQFTKKLAHWIGIEADNYQCFLPTTAKAFGSVNRLIKEEVKRMAREEGILADPIYSAKLFYAARQRIVEEKLTGNILIIHSGGILTMPNFQY